MFPRVVFAGCTSRALRKNHRQPSIIRSLLSTSSSSDDGGVSHYLEKSLGIDDRVLHEGIVKEIESFQGESIRVEHLEALGKETLEALAASVKEEKDRAAKNNKELKTKSRPSLPIRISVPHENKEFVLDWKLGSSLLDVAKDNEETMGNSHIEGACGGTMSCCTCHVYIEPPDFREYLIEPTDTELDMLDLAYAPRDNSRLGCQVKLTPAILKSPMLKQFEVTIPPGVNNVFDC